MLLFIRHGETVWGHQRRNQGALDSPLTDLGIRQSLMNKKILSSILDLTAPELTVYISPSTRSMETYKLIFENNKNKLIVDERIKAVSAGSWDGKSYIQLKEQGVELDEFDWQFHSPDGETYEDARKRANNWLQSVKEPSVVISHGLIGRIIFGEYLGYGYKDSLSIRIRQNAVYKFDAGKITEITIDSC